MGHRFGHCFGLGTHVLTLLVTVALAAGCAPPPVAPVLDESAAAQVSRERQLYADVQQQGSAEPLYRLEVFTTSLLTDGQVLKIRGKLRNPMPDPVDGVRLLFKAYRRDAKEGDRPLATRQTEKSLHIAAGDSAALRWDVETMYAATEAKFTVEAYAQRIGGRDVSPPPEWKGE